MIKRVPKSDASRRVAARREELYLMFDGRCFYCAGPLICDTIEPSRDWLFTKPALHVLAREHMHPTARGGGEDADNIVPACLRCNNAKGAFTLDEYRVLNAFRAGDFDFAFPFEMDRPVKVRDWLMCHSEHFERSLHVHNAPEAAHGYAAVRGGRAGRGAALDG